MTPAGSFPFANDLSLRHSRWRKAVAGAGGKQVLPDVAGYTIERIVGEGRMSTAYLAQDRERGGKVVLKMLRHDPAASELRAASFVQEFAVPTGIEHPNVIRVLDLFVGRPRAYIAMEYVGGGDLSAAIRSGLTAGESVALLRQGARALAQVHRAGFVHCDVKPANLLMRYSGDLVLADFGLARPADGVQQPAAPGVAVGTPCYAAPELAQGGVVGTAADVYSLGVVFYEMLCGKPPFPGRTLMEVVCQHLVAPVPRLPGPLAHLQPLVDRMLHKQVQGRLADGEALLDAINLLEGAEPLPPAPAGANPSRCPK